MVVDNEPSLAAFHVSEAVARRQALGLSILNVGKCVVAGIDRRTVVHADQLIAECDLKAWQNFEGSHQIISLNLPHIIRSPRRRGICFPSPIRAGDLVGIAPTLRLRTKVLQVIRERIVAHSALHRHAQTRPTPWEGEMKTGTVIAAGMIGNVLEWYDFAIYGYFAAAIGRQFFPHEDA